MMTRERILFIIAGVLSVVLMITMIVQRPWQKVATNIVNTTTSEVDTDNDLDSEEPDPNVENVIFDPAEHKSTFVRGEVLGLSGFDLQIRTDQGDKAFRFTVYSKIMSRADGTIDEIKRDELVDGDRVLIDYNEDSEIRILEKY